VWIGRSDRLAGGRSSTVGHPAPGQIAARVHAIRRGGVQVGVTGPLRPTTRQRDSRVSRGWSAFAAPSQRRLVRRRRDREVAPVPDDFAREIERGLHGLAPRSSLLAPRSTPPRRSGGVLVATGVLPGAVRRPWRSRRRGTDPLGRAGRGPLRELREAARRREGFFDVVRSVGWAPRPARQSALLDPDGAGDVAVLDGTVSAVRESRMRYFLAR